MSRWTHSACVGCWNERNPDRRVGIAIDGEPDVCCFCGGINCSGIYVREDPALMFCGGCDLHHDGAARLDAHRQLAD